MLPLPALPPAARGLPAFVGGGTTDLVVDWQAVQETAAWFGVQPTKWEDMAHDCMLVSSYDWQGILGQHRFNAGGRSAGEVHVVELSQGL